MSFKEDLIRTKKGLSCGFVLIIMVSKACVFRFSAPQVCSFRLSDRLDVLSRAVKLSQRRCSVKPVNAEPKTNASIVPIATTIAAAGKCVLLHCVIRD